MELPAFEWLKEEVDFPLENAGASLLAPAVAAYPAGAAADRVSRRVLPVLGLGAGACFAAMAALGLFAIRTVDPVVLKSIPGDR